VTVLAAIPEPASIGAACGSVPLELQELAQGVDAILRRIQPSIPIDDFSPASYNKRYKQSVAARPAHPLPESGQRSGKRTA